MENLTKKSMILKKIKAAALCCLVYISALVALPSGLHAQDALTAVLEQLPASNAKDEQRLFKELMASGESNLSKLTSLVVPNGQNKGVKPRYAISLLTHTVADAGQKKVLENVYLGAMADAKDDEVKQYFLTNLNLVASDASIDKVKPLLASKSLVDPAIGLLVTINSEASKQALLAALPSASADVQPKLIKALGSLRYAPAATPLASLATSQDQEIKRQALWALARIADPASSNTLLTQAQQVKFKAESTEAAKSLVEYMRGLSVANPSAAADLAQKVLASTDDPSLQHIRLAALGALVKGSPDKATKVLIAESKKFDTEYQREVLKLSVPTAISGEKSWMKEYKAAKGARQADLLNLLADARRGNAAAQETFFDAQVVPALKSTSAETRMAAAERLTLGRNKKYIAPLLDYLMSSADAMDIQAASSAISKLASREDGKIIAQKLSAADDVHKIALIRLLAGKRSTDQFEDVKALTGASGDSVKIAAYQALPKVSSSGNVDALLKLLSTTANEARVQDVQSALIASVDEKSASAVLKAYESEPLKIIPVLPYTPDKNALTKVLAAFSSGDGAQKQAAFTALTNWPDESSVRALMKILKDPSLQSYHNAASESILSHVVKSNLPDDQKLLLVREVMSTSTDKKQKAAALRAAGSIRTFLSLVFVSEYLDDPELGSVASRSAMTVALPASDGRAGLSGVEVRKILNRMADKLTGGDSQYEKIDIMTYLEKMPHVIGYESIFNGKDLGGWQGLVEDPIKRSKMTATVLAKKQQEANAKVSKNWSVKDGMIVFQGDGANLCTIRKYGDFEMYVDWKISKNGDSGIYLRGSPQVQIWDTTRRDVGAQVGSGGLYNNQKGASKPSTVADNPIGEWNTFHVRMIGERVWVKLNGVLVVDSVVLENYWDRSLPIFAEEAIELQAHGTDLAFRNIYVKELNTKPYQVSAEEQKAGFKPLFDGKTLDNWIGNKTDYVVEGNTIALYPGEKSHGNLYTEKEYSDFTMRFEFQLTPGANNGLGIHAPLEGDAAYVGKELQILDNTSPQYAQLQPYQYHGSVYGILAAKRDYLKPVGEWNEQEVYVKGDHIRITLNGTVIVDGDLKKATANGTADHKDHPGLQRHSGHIGFLGHGSVVRFRNLRINEIK
ncbi:family 16 glycoside hydrolase [Chryseolinea sp. T2]|uniref:family 16 glycoside hydrolase n=1 Tax=Chryseolinea sp. T2 TaxID=3129255 RepID=UPI003077071C